MKILYVVSRPIEINTSASIRNHATIMGLIENGHQLTIVSSKPDKNHPAYDNSLTVVKAKLIYLNLRGVQSVAKFSQKYKVLTKIKPFIYHLLFGNEIYDNLKAIIEHVREINICEYDLIISSSDPKSSHLFVDRLLENNQKKIPWIQIWGDPFVDDITRTNNSKTKSVEDEENRLLSKADKIVYVSKMTCESQKVRYISNREKMIYLPIPYYKERRSGKIFPAEYKKVKLCYCGDYGSYVRNISALYEAVNELGISLIICGMSDLKLNSSKQIKVFPRQGADKVREFEADADVLVHLSNLSGTQIPGKIYQYVSTDKTILFILDGDKTELENTFNKYNRFIFADNTKPALVEILKNICELRNKVINEPVEYFGAKSITKELLYF